MGMKWDLKSDKFAYHVRNSENPIKWTKRTVLAKVASIYDPIGHAAPVALVAKLFMQTLWREMRKWDEEVSIEFREKWLAFWNEIRELEKVEIPRWIRLEKNVNLELHGFADASEKGYGAVIYVRAEKPNGEIIVTQLTAKSRVAPLNIVSIPRLELAAATLLAKLMNHVRRTMEWENIPYFLKTDSTITLQWLKKEPCELKMFVGNRVAFIQEHTDVNVWSHIKSNENPADLASRGLMPSEIVNNELWWNGPPWLQKPKSEWPKPLEPEINETFVRSELKIFAVSKVCDALTIHTITGEEVSLIDYSNNLNKLMTILCYIKRFKRGLKREQVRFPLSKRRKPKLIWLPTAEEKAEAMKFFIKREQKLSY